MVIIASTSTTINSRVRIQGDQALTPAKAVNMPHIIGMPSDDIDFRGLTTSPLISLEISKVVFANNDCLFCRLPRSMAGGIYLGRQL